MTLHHDGITEDLDVLEFTFSDISGILYGDSKNVTARYYFIVTNGQTLYTKVTAGGNCNKLDGMTYAIKKFLPRISPGLL